MYEYISMNDNSNNSSNNNNDNEKIWWKIEIRSMGIDKIVATFLITNLSPPTYLHYHSHDHHHYHHFYYYYYHHNTNKYLCLCLNTYIYNKRTWEMKPTINIEMCYRNFLKISFLLFFSFFLEYSYWV